MKKSKAGAPQKYPWEHLKAGGEPWIFDKRIRNTIEASASIRKKRYGEIYSIRAMNDDYCALYRVK